MDSVLNRVEKGSPIPLYHQVEQALESAIQESVIAAGSLLDNEYELAESLGVSRLTLRRAIDSLVDKGLLVRERGVGTRVVAPQKVSSVLVAGLTSLHEDLTANGAHPTTKVLSAQVVPCPEVEAEHLGVAPESPLFVIERLRSVDGSPVALMWNAFDPAVFTATAEELERSSLYALLRQRGIDLRVADQSIMAVVADRKIGSTLSVAKGSALLRLERLSYDVSGRCVEHARTWYAAERYFVSMRLVKDR